MQTIKISRTSEIISQDSNQAYKILSGTVQLYLQPITEGDINRRKVMLCEMCAGDVVPACAAPLELQERTSIIRIVLSSVDGAEAEVIENCDAVRGAFLDKLEIGHTDSTQITLDCVISEYFKEQLVRKFGNADAALRAVLESETATITNIGDTLRKHKSAAKSSGNLLYDAAEALCKCLKIECAPLDEIKKAAGERDITLDDIARISGFSVRRVILEDKWYKKDVGPLLVYAGKEKTPAVAVRGKLYGYKLLGQGKTVKVTEQVAANLQPVAYMFYRSFPAGKIGLKDLCQFFMKDLNPHECAMLVALMTAETCVGLLLPTATQEIYDRYIPFGNTQLLVVFCIVIVICVITNVLFAVVKRFANHHIFSRVRYSAQSAAFERLLNLPVGYLRQFESAHLLQQTFDITIVVNFLQSSLFMIGVSSLLSFLYFWRMCSYEPHLAAAGLLLAAFYICVTFLISVMEYKRRCRIKTVMKMQDSISYQLIGAIDKIRAANAETRGLQKYFNIYTETTDLLRQSFMLDSVKGMATAAINGISMILFYNIAIRNHAGLSFGNFVAFMTAWGLFFGAMSQLSLGAKEVCSVLPAYYGFHALMEEPKEVDPNMDATLEITGKIDIDNVSFGYSDDKCVIKNLSLSIKPGDYIGIAGASGCGKSTLLSLLLGFRRPQTGKIYYDNKDLDSINHRELRRHFGTVLQNGQLIDGNIYDNITLTRPTATAEEITQAVKDAGLEKDIAAMPMGLNTIVTQNTISGGQRQRILIARALLAQPDILFFDEATSALDNETQENVCRSIETLKCTKIVIAHRMSTIKNCSRIIVMDAGRIVEDGTYSELVAQNGLFRRLVERQIV